MYDKLHRNMIVVKSHHSRLITLQGINISPKNGILKMIFLFPRWDMLIPWRVVFSFVLGDRVGRVGFTYRKTLQNLTLVAKSTPGQHC